MSVARWTSRHRLCSSDQPGRQSRTSTNQEVVGRENRRVNLDGQPTLTHHDGIAFFVPEGVHYEVKHDVATSAVAHSDDNLNVRLSRFMILDSPNLSPSSTSTFLRFGPSMVGISVSIPIFSQPHQILSFWETSMPTVSLGTQIVRRIPLVASYLAY